MCCEIFSGIPPTPRSKETPLEMFAVSTASGFSKCVLFVVFRFSLRCLNERVLATITLGLDYLR